MNERNRRRLAIWNRLTPAQRDYDRLVARQIPHGASPVPETEEGWQLLLEQEAQAPMPPEGCSCHIHPPCDYCTSQDGLD